MHDVHRVVDTVYAMSIYHWNMVNTETHEKGILATAAGPFGVCVCLCPVHNNEMHITKREQFQFDYSAVVVCITNACMLDVCDAGRRHVSVALCQFPFQKRPFGQLFHGRPQHFVFVQEHFMADHGHNAAYRHVKSVILFYRLNPNNKFHSCDPIVAPYPLCTQKHSRTTMCVCECDCDPCARCCIQA